MGKSSLVMEQYPTFNENHKKKTKSTTRMEAKLAKIGKWGAQAKADLKKERRLKKKLIDKSRRNKRQLKNTELEIKTPQQERDAYDEVEAAYLVETYDHMIKLLKDPRWYIEVTTSPEGDQRSWVSFKLKRECVELCDHDEVFYNSDGESVLFDDMEPV